MTDNILSFEAAEARSSHRLQCFDETCRALADAGFCFPLDRVTERAVLDRVEQLMPGRSSATIAKQIADEFMSCGPASEQRVEPTPSVVNVYCTACGQQYEQQTSVPDPRPEAEEQWGFQRSNWLGRTDRPLVSPERAALDICGACGSREILISRVEPAPRATVTQTTSGPAVDLGTGGVQQCDSVAQATEMSRQINRFDAERGRSSALAVQRLSREIGDTVAKIAKLGEVKTKHFELIALCGDNPDLVGADGLFMTAATRAQRRLSAQLKSLELQRESIVRHLEAAGRMTPELRATVADPVAQLAPLDARD
jgi:hypothetical protein